MKFTRNSLVILFCAYCLSCAPARKNTGASTTAVTTTLPATALQPAGRFVVNQDNGLEMISSAMHFGFSFEGTECRVFATIPNVNGHNYLQYELDGVYQKRLKIVGNVTEPILLTAPTEGTHTVWIYKATEAHTGPVIIQKVTGTKLKPLKTPRAPLIEFIGNSITCGAAADPSDVPCGTGQYHDQYNAYMAYGPRVARALGANFVVSSVSGIGVYRNWNSDGPTMPEVYEKVDFQATNSQRWNFKTDTPQVVSIALGTNDFSRGDGKKERLPFDSARYVTSYIGFVEVVKSKYPKAQIVLLSSPMVNGENREQLQRCLTAVKGGIDAANPADRPVVLHFFQPMRASGCSGHPSVDDHAVIAQELLPLFRKLLN
ncbi:SGNH/GDSL hydrolase family protein [Spirosoma arcticum]